MVTIDVQVHAYEKDHQGRPWAGILHGPPEVTGDDMVEAMDAVGVDGALLVSPWTMYRFDASYALEVYDQHPGRFGLIKPFDPNSADVTEQIADWAAKPGAVGARIMMVGNVSNDPDDIGVNSVLSAGADHGLPVNILCWGKLPLLGELARRNPDTQLIVDHLGLHQPFEPPAPADPFANLDQVIDLAQHDNVAVKVSGACTLSHQRFPYNDLWEPLGRLFEAFGLERCMWGTDWTRAVELLTYEQGVEAFRATNQLSDGDRSALMGATLEAIYGWSPTIT
jgi:predicted TIM-barrel fold metal-dependent hydrolase